MTARRLLWESLAMVGRDILQPAQVSPKRLLLVAFKPNRLIRKHTDGN
jgi:hypothetical protein